MEQDDRSGEIGMKWCRRVILAAPFAVAASLTMLMLVHDALHFRTEHVAGYGFLFSTPWAWLLDRDWYAAGAHPANWVDMSVAYALILWIPAALYSLSLWLLMHGVGRLMGRRSTGQSGETRSTS